MRTVLYVFDSALSDSDLSINTSPFHGDVTTHHDRWGYSSGDIDLFRKFKLSHYLNYFKI